MPKPDTSTTKVAERLHLKNNAATTDKLKLIQSTVMHLGHVSVRESMCVVVLAMAV